MNLRKKTVCYRAFSLTELLAALVIGTLVIVASLGVYSRMRRSSIEINRRIDDQQLPNEILQRIAEDLDSIVAPASGKTADTKITIANKPDELFPSAQLKITRTYYDKNNKPQPFEEIIWQSNYDFDTDALILYRSHKGLTVEDRLLGMEKDQWKRELFVPIASGLTLFTIEIPKGEDDYVDSWTSGSLPNAVRVSISFIAPFKTIEGRYDVYEDEKIVRTIAIDRTRNIKFEHTAVDFNELASDFNDPNLNDLPDINDINEPEDTNDTKR